MREKQLNVFSVGCVFHCSWIVRGLLINFLPGNLGGRRRRKFGQLKTEQQGGNEHTTTTPLPVINVDGVRSVEIRALPAQQVIKQRI